MTFEKFLQEQAEQTQKLTWTLDLENKFANHLLVTNLDPKAEKQFKQIVDNTNNALELARKKQEFLANLISEK